MKIFIYLSILSGLSFSFLKAQDSLEYTKKVLDKKELSLISSYYNQNGSHAAVSGGEGTEKLDDITTSVIMKIPIKEDGVLSVDAGISAYSSASSSNINPFDQSSASRGDDDDDEKRLASPWVASSGASGSDVYAYINANYAHSSKDRNKIASANIGASNEYDYKSFHIGFGYAFLWNEKNTTLDFKGAAYFDRWKLIYPTELSAWRDTNGNLNAGFFAGVDILPFKGYNPVNFTEIDSENRNTYSGSIAFSQILSPSIQMSIFGDVIYQSGVLNTPFHRVYFKDREDFFIENFQLADDREKLPDTRLKIPLGMRFNAYLNDRFILRTYYRFYTDDWNLNSHTFQIGLPIKLSNTLTITPDYRYYTQTAVKYFQPFDAHSSTEQFYTSDYDLSGFSSNQFGGELKIAPPFGVFKIRNKSYLKSFIMRYQYYKRDIDFDANIVTMELNFVL